MSSNRANDIVNAAKDVNQDTKDPMMQYRQENDEMQASGYKFLDINNKSTSEKLVIALKNRGINYKAKGQLEEKSFLKMIFVGEETNTRIYVKKEQFQDAIKVMLNI